MPVEAEGASEVIVPASTIATVVYVVPSLLVAIWNMFGKFEAVPLPVLETLAENDSLCPGTLEALAVVLPAVRSGIKTVQLWFA